MTAEKKLFLLDGMALAYRAHFALINRPIRTSKGFNTSALYGFTQTLLDILKNQQPTHLAVAFDTSAPTQRHTDFAEYKIQREAMPEELTAALPHLFRLLEVFQVPVLTCDGYEADDIIGTLVRQAEREGFISYMVTPDKDFSQLVTERTYLYRPSRMGDGVEVLGPDEVRRKWGISRPEQTIDLLALWGDASDNIPGVPGIGEKTAAKLIGQYGTVENVLSHTAELKGKLRENIETFRDQALLSKKLATILLEVPCRVDLESLRVREPDEKKLKEFLAEFEFNTIGKRLFGEEFKAGRGFTGRSIQTDAPAQPDLEWGERGEPAVAAAPPLPLRRLEEVPHAYRILDKPTEQAALFERLRQAGGFGFSTRSTGPDPKQARLLGLAFASEQGQADFIPVPPERAFQGELFAQLEALLAQPALTIIGHDLKYDLALLRWQGIGVRTALFDLALAHSLVEPEMRHTLEYLSEALLGYSPKSRAKWTEALPSEIEFASDRRGEADAACEQADLALALRPALEAQLAAREQKRVFYEIESPLIPVLVDMEYEGIRVDAQVLADCSAQLARTLAQLQERIWRLAGQEFNLNSPRQLGEILFTVLKICENPKKTRTGQFATDEQTLQSLAPEHEIVRLLLENRELSKLKSTYTDTLPGMIWPRTGRVHTTYFQTATATGRLNSQNPNLQNIPIRTEQGKEIRRAFVARDDSHALLSADYSQVELRIIASLSREPGLQKAFAGGVDIHTATAARVFGVSPGEVTPEMRRRAKMVNFGIAYGMSAFGLSQRLGIPRRDAAAIIDQYFQQFPTLRAYVQETIAFAREHGYVQTMTGRRRYVPEIRSANATVRSAGERNAINAPIQGSAADLIKLAMVRIHQELERRQLRTRMLLQVHDELVFDLFLPEQEEVAALVQELMKTAIPLEVPVEVEIGIGRNWLEAH